MWFIFTWWRDTSLEYGCPERNAFGVGVMAIVCYELLLFLALGVLSFLIHRL